MAAALVVPAGLNLHILKHEPPSLTTTTTTYYKRPHWLVEAYVRCLIAQVHFHLILISLFFPLLPLCAAGAKEQTDNWAKNGVNEGCNRLL